jgi:hypothetical protein
MVSHLFFYQLGLIVLVWLCVMLQWVWPSAPAAACSTTPEPPPPRRKRSREPKPFVGLITKPPCDACAAASGPHPHAPANRAITSFTLVGRSHDFTCKPQNSEEPRGENAKRATHAFQSYP